MATARPDLIGHLLDGESAVTTPRVLHGWEGPIDPWPCHCCDRMNDERVKRCKTCGRSAAYVPPMHLPFFGTMAKALRREQAIFLLDQRGFEVNATDSENYTPAHLASMYGNVDLLEVLVDRGARLEAQTKRGWKPLHFAAQGGHLPCVQLLLGRNARASSKTKECLSTPLHVASGAGFVDVCRCLLEKAVDPKARDMMDRTALHLAADKGHLEVVKALLEAGAGVDVLDHDNWSPRQSAEFRGFMEVAKVLAKGHSILKKGEGATHGASAALPPAPWHMELFAQVRLDTARQRISHAVAATRELAYARYANIYKDHAAETYACNIEATRQGKGAREAYRRRVVAASTDAGRYRGYVETNTPRDGRGGEGGPLLGTGGRSVSSGFGSPSSDVGVGSSNDSGAAEFSSLGDGSSSSSSVTSTSHFGSCVGSSSLEEGSPSFPIVAEGGGSENASLHDVERLGDGAASECSAITGGGSEIHSVLWAGDCAVYGDAAAATGRGGVGGGGDGGGGGTGAFVDVVRFNNIRAKYLRPWDDMKLSGMYHVAPSPDWRANRTAGSRGSSTPGSADALAALSVGSGRTMEAYRKIRQNDPTDPRRRSRTLNWKDRKAWGAH